MYKKLLVLFGIVCIISPWLHIAGLAVRYSVLLLAGVISLAAAAIINAVEKRA